MLVIFCFFVPMVILFRLFLECYRVVNRQVRILDEEFYVFEWNLCWFRVLNECLWWLNIIKNTLSDVNIFQSWDFGRLTVELRWIRSWIFVLFGSASGVGSEKRWDISIPGDTWFRSLLIGMGWLFGTVYNT